MPSRSQDVPIKGYASEPKITINEGKHDVQFPPICVGSDYKKIVSMYNESLSTINFKWAFKPSERMPFDIQPREGLLEGFKKQKFACIFRPSAALESFNSA